MKIEKPTDLEKARLEKGISKYRIAKDCGLRYSTVSENLREIKAISAKNYLRIKKYLENN